MGLRSRRGWAAMLVALALSALGLATTAAPSGSASTGITLSGFVRDSSGAPVGAQVSASQGAESGVADTAADGSYSISLPPGTYTFTVNWAGGGFGDGPPFFSGTATLTLTASRVENVTVPAPTTVNLQAVDSKGAPVPQAGVYFTDTGSSVPGTLGDGTPIKFASAELAQDDGATDANGAFSLQTFLGTSFSVMIAPANALSFTTTVNVTASPTNAVIHLPAPVVLSGVVKNASGAPSPASISLGQIDGNGGVSTSTAADGSYALSVLPGKYHFDITWPAGSASPLSYGGEATITVVGKQTENVTLPATATVTVHVVDSTRAPLAHDVVILPPAVGTVSSTLSDSSPIQFSAGSTGGQVGTTSATNTYSFQALLGTSLPVTVGPAHMLSHTATVNVAADPTDVTIQVPAGVSLTGTVRDSAGKPTFATLAISGANGSGVPFQGPNGSFSIFVPPGSYTVSASWGSSVNSVRAAFFGTAPITVTGNKVANITLPPQTTVHVHVVDSVGAPVANAGVYPTDSGPPVTSRWSDGTVMSSLSPVYEQPAQTDGSGTASYRVLVGTTFPISIQAANSLSETVRVTASAPPSNATVKIPYLIETMFAPSMPAAVSAVPGDSSVIVRWTQAGNGGSQITESLVAVYLGSTKVITYGFGSGTTAKIDLQNGKTYRFQVSSVNALGTSPLSTFSNLVTVGTPTSPGKPVAATATGHGRAKLKWSVPASSNGATITGYVVTPYRNGVAQPPKTSKSKASSEFITGLTTGKRYTFTVAAKNSRGTGITSTLSNAVTIK